MGSKDCLSNASSPSSQNMGNKDSSNRARSTVNFSLPLATADNRTARRKIGTGFVPSFSATALHDVKQCFSPTNDCSEEQPEVKPYGVDIESWFESQNISQSAESRQVEYPSMKDGTARPSSYLRLSETMPMGVSVKNIRRMSTLVDDCYGRSSSGGSRRASTGSLPPASQAGFCIPQVRNFRSTSYMQNYLSY